ncbi:MAG: cupin domain-containing protein [Acidimicrobiales bacterium]
MTGLDRISMGDGAPEAEFPVTDIVAALGLEPLPVEGGLFASTWRSFDGDRLVGSAIYAAYTDDPDSFSALHRLPIDEIWHHYLGDAVELLLLTPGEPARTVQLGSDIPAGQRPQIVVPAGTWMGGGVVLGGRFALCGTTMAPGFEDRHYEGADVATLARQWPDQVERITALVRPGRPTRMADPPSGPSSG